MLKIGEKLVKEVIMEHLLSNNMINRSQHGFLPLKSTNSNLIEYLADISKAMDKGDVICALMTDFSKCFDKLPKSLIRHALEKRYSITGDMLNWLINWLSNRKQRVILNGEYSEWIEVVSGCVQGSILGPLIALCLLDTVDDHLSFCRVSKYADDDKFYASVNSVDDQKRMQSDINKITKWAREWSFVLNSDKCQLLQFGGSTLYDFTMNGTKVKRVNYARDLGIMVDNKLNWNDQIKSVVSKSKRRAFCLSRALISKKTDIWVKLFKTYVRSIIEYGITAYCPYKIGQLNKLESVQRWTTRQIPGIGKYSYEDRLKICHLPSIEQRLQRGIALETYKFINGYSGLSSDRMTQVASSYCLRSISNLNLYQEFSRSETRKYSFTCRAPTIWNNIPLDVKYCTSKNSFKNNYDKWISTV